MSDPNATVRPLGVGNWMQRLGFGPRPAAPAPQASPALPPDLFVRQTAAAAPLRNDRFANNPELAAIAAGRLAFGNQLSPATIQTVQQALQDMAFLVPTYADGRIGGATIRGIKNFQIMAGLTPDGVLGPQTLAALDRLAPAAGKTSWDRGSNPGPVPDPNVGYGKKARVVVSIGQHRAFLYDKQGRLMKIYGVRTGKEQVDAQGKAGHPTHPGVKIIEAKNADPTEVSNLLWPESGGQAFGTRLLELKDYDPATGQVSRGRYAGQELHGTYQDSSIGRDFSHGCVGMRNPDIEEVFAQVRSGELVRFE